MKTEGRLDNITYTQAGFSYFVGQESGKFIPKVFGIVLLMKFSAENPRLRKAAKRYQ